MQEDRKTDHPADDDGPPTLPLPSMWRLVVAAAAIIGVLYLMYDTGRDAEAPPPPSAVGSGTQ
jgi:hypothetical protein